MMPRHVCTIAVAFAAVCGFETALAAETGKTPRAHEPSSWRTVVIPVKPSVAMVATASIPKPVPVARPLTGVAHDLRGIASFYWQGQKTASGEPFNPGHMTAAHRTLPFGTKVRVTHSRSGRSVIVRINDRGPFKPGRVIDLSKAAAEQLQMTGMGLAAVQLEVVQ